MQDADGEPDEVVQSEVQKGLRCRSPGAGAASVPAWTCPPTWKLSEPCALGIFIEASSCRHDRLLTSLSVPLPSTPLHSPLLSRELGMGLTVQASNPLLVFLVTRPHSDAHHKSAHWNKRCFCHPGNYKGLRNSISGTGQIIHTCIHKLKKQQQHWIFGLIHFHIPSNSCYTCYNYISVQ